MRKSIIAGLISVLFLVGCGPKELTPEQKQQVEGLKTELSLTSGDIDKAKAEDQKYSSGLIKSLIKAKLEVLETNKALLQQRINSIESGAKIEIIISGIKPDPVAAGLILKDIDSLKIEIDSARKEASQYSGGLVQAMKLAAIATQEQTLAILNQRYLSAKYGLAEIKIASPTINPPASLSNSKPKPNDDRQSTDVLLPPADGPFGLQAGLTRKNIEDMTGSSLIPVEGSHDLYMANSTPRKNPDFSSVGLIISSKVGLCQIRAIGKDVKTDSYGISLRAKFEEISDRLSSIYGKGKKTDFVLPESIWRDPDGWMMGLKQKERELFTTWEGVSEEMKKNNINNIILYTRANDSSSGYVFLQYTFTNNEVCESEIEDAKKGSL